MNTHLKLLTTSVASIGILLGLSGCKQLPGTPEQQGAVIGGVGGAAAGAAIGGSEHRLLGALLGGALGAGGGYLIGANTDKLTGKDKDEATEAVRRAQTNPATPQQAKEATTADLNRDGFVTMDEVVAMKQAGYSDSEILTRMKATGQVFELTSEQREYLQTNGVSQSVIDRIPDLNREARDRVLSQTKSSQYPPPTGGYPYPPPPVNSPDRGPNTPVPPPPGP